MSVRLPGTRQRMTWCRIQKWLVADEQLRHSWCGAVSVARESMYDTAGSAKIIAEQQLRGEWMIMMVMVVTIVLETTIMPIVMAVMRTYDDDDDHIGWS
jgi:hypothetical protein